MSAIGLVILQMMMMLMTRSANGEFGGGGGGGGPSTFGYDGSSACTKPYSRHARARFEKLPCDFRRQNWCTVAGSAYPWHAVRRFVQENHGLMRRMYGDERQINILKAELEKNDIELEYEDRYQRYPDESRQFQYDDEYEFVNFANQRQRSRKHEDYNVNDDVKFNEAQSRSFTDESLDESIVTDRTRKYTKTSIEYTRSANTASTSESTTVPNPSTTSAVSSSTKSSIDSENPGTTSTTTIANPENKISTQTSTLKVPTTLSTEKIPSTNINDRNSSTIGENNASTLSTVTLADIARIKNSSINEIPGQLSDHLEPINRDDFDRTELPIVTESTITIELDITTIEIGSTTADAVVTTSSTVPTNDRVDEVTDLDENDDFKVAPVADQIFASSEQDEPAREQFRPRPEYKPTESKPEMANIEGQLFQDVAAKDQQEQPILKFRGVNACPVKEEVVAPFWANNTRGEVLALLNLYPFEQYVHWERCTHENKQMYCRDGCRCEQQYRLHRLLAYDPNNECRGIFSDWFKFPSSCVCRCYDLPIEFRVTSRSPRIQKQKLRLRPPGQGRG